ncbi:hypothetical protein KIW84_043479 [Lathyrus oleraceus]|uniref:Uncharacterized protein n=1 Tax=Pisum sativum TaxID=3888 RepID=A0A9D4XFB6_PEA|nr:hypothetical protein KIW84_043479 [Pisum sativum]
MSQSSASTPGKHTKEHLNPKNIGTDIDLFEVITDFVPSPLVPSHATPIRKPRTHASRKGKPYKKPHSVTSLYLDPINVEPNVDASAKCPIVQNVMDNFETYENTSKPRSVTTFSKSSMIVTDRDDVDNNIHVLISQVLGIKPKTGVVSDVSTSLAQPDNTIETPLDKFDVNMSTQSP